MDPTLDCAPDLAPAPQAPAVLIVASRQVRLRFVRHRRARRYVLRLKPDGVAQVTIPRGGSTIAATDFARRQVRWIERQLHRQETRPRATERWLPGTVIWFRGELTPIETYDGIIRFADQSVTTAGGADGLRPAIEAHLRRLATAELPPRVIELAARHQMAVRLVSVRNQRTRWGSCSARGTISLNWRLVQVPASVLDYIILHELMHVRVRNHSTRFWAEVERVCPDYLEAERWLKAHGDVLRC